jgi:hypothetical protein
MTGAAHLTLIISFGAARPHPSSIRVIQGTTKAMWQAAAMGFRFYFQRAPGARQ